MNETEEILERAGIKPTSNRILVLREILRSGHPLSLMDLDEILDSLDKSSISRVLSILLEHGAIHAVEDGRGIVRYETSHESDNDMHAHFYCERCRKVYCFEDIPTPSVKLPAGFYSRSVNYMIKGICPGCRKK